MKTIASIAAVLLVLAACSGEPPREHPEQTLAASVNTAPPAPAPAPLPPPKPPTAWTIRLNTYGGLRGTGKGSIEIESADAASSNKCKLAVLRDESVRQALRDARPEKWVGCYKHAAFSGLTDQFSYHFIYRVERGDEQPITYEVSWQDDSKGMRPADLSLLADSVWNVYKKANCTP